MVEEWRAAGSTISEDPLHDRTRRVSWSTISSAPVKRSPSRAPTSTPSLWFNERRAKKLSLDVSTGLNPATGNWISDPSPRRRDDGVSRR